MNILERYDGPCVAEDGPKQLKTPSIIDNLKRRKMQKEEELSRINAAIEGLEANPAVLQVLELVAKA